MYGHQKNINYGSFWPHWSVVSRHISKVGISGSLGLKPVVAAVGLRSMYNPSVKETQRSTAYWICTSTLTYGVKHRSSWPTLYLSIYLSYGHFSTSFVNKKRVSILKKQCYCHLYSSGSTVNSLWWWGSSCGALECQ